MFLSPNGLMVVSIVIKSQTTKMRCVQCTVLLKMSILYINNYMNILLFNILFLSAIIYINLVYRDTLKNISLQ